MCNCPEDKFFSITWQILEDCDKECGTCHAIKSNDLGMCFDKQKKVVDHLAGQGCKRLCITGGEPTLLKEQLYRLLEYVHSKEIHVSLSTHVERLSKDDIHRIDTFLDHIIIPVHFVGMKDNNELCNWAGHLENIREALDYVLNTGIIIEIITIVSKLNVINNNVIINNIGDELAKIFHNNEKKLIWRLDQYYATKGSFTYENRLKYQIDMEEFSELTESISKASYLGNVDEVRSNSVKSREKAKDFLIRPYGLLATTSSYEVKTIKSTYKDIGTSVKQENRHPWECYKKLCRNWKQEKE